MPDCTTQTRVDWSDIGPLLLVIALDGVGFDFGDCYPGAGTVTIGKGAAPEVIELTESTASTGAFTLSGPIWSTLNLPSYGECPE